MIQNISTLEELHSLIGTGSPIIVDMWAPWCGPCRTLAPIFDNSAQSNSDIIYVKVDVEAAPEVAGHFSVRGIPTLLGFSNNELKLRSPGSAATLSHMVDVVRKASIDAEF